MYNTVGKHLKNRTMKIKFNDIEKSIEIKDGLKTQYLMIKMMIIITLLNSILFPVFVLDKKEPEWLRFTWVILGLTCLIMLIYLVMKKSTSEKLILSEINSLTEKQIFGRKRFSLKLKNGKMRDLIEMKNELDIKETKELFQNIGIETN
jgi:glucan phosphoethanolaminetransferase (alkaline phosphatase superfamily)